MNNTPYDFIIIAILIIVTELAFSRHYFTEEKYIKPKKTVLIILMVLVNIYAIAKPANGGMFAAAMFDLIALRALFGKKKEENKLPPLK